MKDDLQVLAEAVRAADSGCTRCRAWPVSTMGRPLPERCWDCVGCRLEYCLQLAETEGELL